jgi:hypothetical protein
MGDYVRYTYRELGAKRDLTSRPFRLQLSEARDCIHWDQRHLRKRDRDVVDVNFLASAPCITRMRGSRTRTRHPSLSGPGHEALLLSLSPTCFTLRIAFYDPNCPMSSILQTPTWDDPTFIGAFPLRENGFGLPITGPAYTFHLNLRCISCYRMLYNSTRNWVWVGNTGRGWAGSETGRYAKGFGRLDVSLQLEHQIELKLLPRYY